MPTATKFEAEGVDNGFMSCISKVNATDYDYWSTFSGVTGLTATDEEIAESRRLAMLFYWNSYKLNILASFDDGGGNTALVESFNSVDDAKDASSFPPIDADELSPKSRVCRRGSDGVFQKFVDAGDLFNTEVGGSAVPSNIVALYAGSIDDYDNFIGYGLGQGIGLSESNAFVILDIIGYVDDLSGIGYDVDYCSIPIAGTTDSLSAVCSAYGTGAATSAANMTATQDSPDDEITLQMKTIENYTYPS